METIRHSRERSPRDAEQRVQISAGIASSWKQRIVDEAHVANADGGEGQQRLLARCQAFDGAQISCIDNFGVIDAQRRVVGERIPYGFTQRIGVVNASLIGCVSGAKSPIDSSSGYALVSREALIARAESQTVLPRAR